MTGREDQSVREVSDGKLVYEFSHAGTFGDQGHDTKDYGLGLNIAEGAPRDWMRSAEQHYFAGNPQMHGRQARIEPRQIRSRHAAEIGRDGRRRELDHRGAIVASEDRAKDREDPRRPIGRRATADPEGDLADTAVDRGEQEFPGQPGFEFLVLVVFHIPPCRQNRCCR